MKRLRLLPDWGRVLRQAWSVRLMLLAGLLSGCEAVLPLVTDHLPWPRWVSSLVVLGVVGGAFVTRLLAQQGGSNDNG
jgi:Na+/H+-translocating membrane pyrophosphatase